MPHAAAVIEAGGVATGGGGAGTSGLPGRPPVPRAAAPPLDAVGDVAFPELQMAAVREEERREETMEEEPVAAGHPGLVGQQWS